MRWSGKARERKDEKEVEDEVKDGAVQREKGGGLTDGRGQRRRNVRDDKGEKDVGGETGRGIMEEKEGGGGGRMREGRMEQRMESGLEVEGRRRKSQTGWISQ